MKDLKAFLAASMRGVMREVGEAMLTSAPFLSRHSTNCNNQFRGTVLMGLLEENLKGLCQQNLFLENFKGQRQERVYWKIKRNSARRCLQENLRDNVRKCVTGEFKGTAPTDVLQKNLKGQS